MTPTISGKFKVAGALEVGQDVNLVLQLKNLTRDRKAVTVNMTAWTIVYNGTLVHEVWKDSVILNLDAQEGNLSSAGGVHNCKAVSSLWRTGGFLLGPGEPADWGQSDEWALYFGAWEAAISMNSIKS